MLFQSRLLLMNRSSRINRRLKEGAIWQITISMFMANKLFTEYPEQDECKYYNLVVDKVRSHIDDLFDTLRSKETEILKTMSVLISCFHRFPVSILFFNPSLDVSLFVPIIILFSLEFFGLITCVKSTEKDFINKNLGVKIQKL